MPSAVLDASVILTFLNREPGWERAKEEIEDGIVSSVNLAEVVTILTLDRAPEGIAVALLDELDLLIEPFDERRAIAAGQLVERTHRLGLSLADRACLALAIELGQTAVTADRGWTKLNLGVEIRLIR